MATTDNVHITTTREYIDEHLPQAPRAVGDLCNDLGFRYPWDANGRKPSVLTKETVAWRKEYMRVHNIGSEDLRDWKSSEVRDKLKLMVYSFLLDKAYGRKLWPDQKQSGQDPVLVYPRDFPQIFVLLVQLLWVQNHHKEANEKHQAKRQQINSKAEDMNCDCAQRSSAENSSPSRDASVREPSVNVSHPVAPIAQMVPPKQAETFANYINKSHGKQEVKTSFRRLDEDEIDDNLIVFSPSRQKKRLREDDKAYAPSSSTAPANSSPYALQSNDGHDAEQDGYRRSERKRISRKTPASTVPLGLEDKSSDDQAETLANKNMARQSISKGVEQSLPKSPHTAVELEDSPHTLFRPGLVRLPLPSQQAKEKRAELTGSISPSGDFPTVATLLQSPIQQAVDLDSPNKTKKFQETSGEDPLEAKSNGRLDSFGQKTLRSSDHPASGPSLVREDVTQKDSAGAEVERTRQEIGTKETAGSPPLVLSPADVPDTNVFIETEARHESPPGSGSPGVPPTLTGGNLPSSLHQQQRLPTPLGCVNRARGTRASPTVTFFIKPQGSRGGFHVWVGASLRDKPMRELFDEISSKLGQASFQTVRFELQTSAPSLFVNVFDERTYNLMQRTFQRRITDETRTTSDPLLAIYIEPLATTDRMEIEDEIQAEW
ncbi:MAG: YTH domain-containing protein 2 [Chaenotheca gracillima]|nr:MAG: YTH domain-containing protein 2 [Chaenotheca gracillima]